MNLFKKQLVSMFFVVGLAFLAIANSGHANQPIPPNPELLAEFENKTKIIIYVVSTLEIGITQETRTKENEVRIDLCRAAAKELASGLKNHKIDVVCYHDDIALESYTKLSDTAIAYIMNFDKYKLDNETISVIRSSLITNSTKQIQRITAFAPIKIYRYSGDSIFLAPETMGQVKDFAKVPQWLLNEYLPTTAE